MLVLKRHKQESIRLRVNEECGFLTVEKIFIDFNGCISCLLAYQQKPLRPLHMSSRFTIEVGGKYVECLIVQICGDSVRIGLAADPGVEILRTELLTREKPKG